MQIIPIDHLMIRNAPYPDLGIKWSTNEVSIINRIKLDASYCIKAYTNNESLETNDRKNKKQQTLFLTNVEQIPFRKGQDNL